MNESDVRSLIREELTALLHSAEFHHAVHNTPMTPTALTLLEKIHAIAYRVEGASAEHAVRTGKLAAKFPRAV